MMIIFKILLFVVPIVSGFGLPMKGFVNKFSPEDPRHCMSVSNGKALRVEGILPGGGWDNLMNKEMDIVYSHNYSRCLTDAGRNVLQPDDVQLVTKAITDVEPRSELFEHWNNYTSAFSKSINEQPTFGIESDKISGKYSLEFQNVKNLQYKDNAVTTRIQVRKTRYAAKMNKDAPLAKPFAAKLRKIGMLLALNKTKAAWFLSQKLVDDYGTHVVTSVDVGSALMQTDHVKYNEGMDLLANKRAILAAAARSFVNRFNISHPGMYRLKRESPDDDFTATRTSSDAIALGDTTAWLDQMPTGGEGGATDDTDAVLDRTGIPIFETITTSSLPDVPPFIISGIYNLVKNSVKQYYERNVIRGCTDPGAPNFSIAANVDDGSCHVFSMSYAFGGVYQECESDGVTDLCEERFVKNPKTDDFSCPSSFIPIELDTREVEDARDTTTCEKCWVVFQCCQTQTEYDRATIKAYWCAPAGRVGSTDGFMFGGLYSTNQPNIITEEMSCPKHYSDLTILDDLTICLSESTEEEPEISLSFGGFYTCRFGNPLNSQSGGEYPMTCPVGYSEQLVQVDDCDIHYCIKMGAVQSEPQVRRPPFMRTPWFLLRQSRENKNNTSFVINDDGSVWAPVNRRDMIIQTILMERGYDIDQMDGLDPNISPSALAAVIRARKSAQHVNVGWLVVGSVLATLSFVTVVWLGRRICNSNREKYTKI